MHFKSTSTTNNVLTHSFHNDVTLLLKLLIFPLVYTSSGFTVTGAKRIDPFEVQNLGR